MHCVIHDRIDTEKMDVGLSVQNHADNLGCFQDVSHVRWHTVDKALAKALESAICFSQQCRRLAAD